MATNTTATTQNHNGTGSQNNFAISFSFLANTEVDVKVGGVLKTLGTHYNIVGSEVQFTTGNTPPSGTANIVLTRDTNISAKKVDFADGSVLTETDLDNNSDQILFAQQEIINDFVKRDGTQTVTGNLIFEGATDDGNETTLAITDPTADRTITVPDRSGTIITSGDTGTVTSTMINDGTIVNADINNSANIAGTKLADDSVTLAKLGSGELPSDITVASANIVDGTIVDGDIANTTITGGKLANDTITSTQIGANAVTASELADNAVDTNAVQDDAITYSKIQNVSATNRILGRDSSGAGVIEEITPANLRTMINVEDGATADQTNAEIRAAVEAASDSNVFTDADHSKLNGIEASADVTDATNVNAAGAVMNSDTSTAAMQFVLDEDNFNSNSDTKIPTQQSTKAYIAATSQPLDGELTTLSSMPSATASKLADSTALTSDIADLNQIDGMAKQTTITDDDTKFPTSGAVVDFVAAQLAPIGGLEVIATDAAFPNTQPQAGVVISIADAGGLVVNGSGTSTTGRTVGGSTVTINNFASNFNSSTIDNGVAVMVSSTGSGQVYNYHKATLKEADLLSLSNDINDFAARYRVTNGEPSSNNDEGDLIYDTQADKMKVFDSTTNAFKEVTSVGDFKFLFLCPAGGTGSPTFNGSIATYDLREGSNSGSAASVTNAAQLIVSVDGVIQKPNTGTSAPSEGFALVDSNTIIFGSNLPTGTEVFVIQIGSAVSLQVPADNTVSSVKLQNGSVIENKIANNAVTTNKIADDAVTTDKIANSAVTVNELGGGAVTNAKLASSAVGAGNLQSNAVETTKIQDQAVTLAKLEHGTSSNDGKFLRANNGADPTFESVITDLVNDTTPQLGGNLDTNSFEITLDDDHAVKFGDSGDLEIYHLSSSSINVIRGTLPLTIQTDDTSTGIKLSSYSGGETFAQFKKNGSVDLYHDNGLRFSTSAVGAEVHGDLQIDDNNKIKYGTGGDLEIYHDGSDSYIREAGTGGLKILTNNFSVNNAADSENIIHATQDGAVQLYHNGTEMIKTTSSGIELAKSCQAPLSALSDGSTITVDFSTASHFSVTLGGNRTFGDPSNVSNAVGSSGSIFITQDGTGSRTASFHSDYKFVGGTAPTLSTAANAVDRIDYVVKENHVIHCAISLDVK